MATHQQASDRVQAGFWIHLACYLAVVSGLAILNYERNPDNLWFLWVAGGWGIGIVIHALAFFSDEGRARMIDRTEARLDRREARVDRREARHDAAHMTDKMSEAN
jgi:hypothetical protein